MGVLNMYSTTGGEIAVTAPLIAEALAGQVAGVLDSSREIENLHRALAARKTIGIAVGLLMAEYQLSETAAFAVLRRCSSNTNVRVRDIAARMVAEGNAAVVMPTVHTHAGQHQVPAQAAGDGSPSLRRETVQDDRWFQLTYVDPTGRTYEMTLRAPSDTEAVRLADGALSDVERIGIHEFLQRDGVTVRPPARLHIERVQPHQAVAGLALVVTDPDGTVTRRHLDQSPRSRQVRPFATLGSTGRY